MIIYLIGDFWNFDSFTNCQILIIWKFAYFHNWIISEIWLFYEFVNSENLIFFKIAKLENFCNIPKWKINEFPNLPTWKINEFPNFTICKFDKFIEFFSNCKNQNLTAKTVKFWNCSPIQNLLKQEIKIQKWRRRNWFWHSILLLFEISTLPEWTENAL